MVFLLSFHSFIMFLLVTQYTLTPAQGANKHNIDQRTESYNRFRNVKHFHRMDDD